MRKRKLIILLLMALLPWVTKAQHIYIERTTGDSISCFLQDHAEYFMPVVKDGKVVWSFNHWIPGSDDDKEVLSVDNVESIHFVQDDYHETRKALTEFYQAMNGDYWSVHDNWCSDKPFNEWHGIWTTEEMRNPQSPYCLQLDNNHLKGRIPECITKIGPIHYLYWGSNKLNGEIPYFMEYLHELEDLELQYCGLRGDIPEFIVQYPHLRCLNLKGNNFDGPLPEKLILALANKTRFDGSSIQWDLTLNNFSGKVPESIRNHKKFPFFWQDLLLQNGDMDYSDLLIPAIRDSYIDMNGNTINLGKFYEKNKYTLLYKWSCGSPAAESFNEQLIPAYNQYKEKGLEILGIHMDGYGNLTEEYLKQHNIPWTTNLSQRQNSEALDKDPLADVFPYMYLPQVHLVDQGGNIVFTSVMDKKGNSTLEYGHNQLFSVLEDLLGKVNYDDFYTSIDYSHDGEVATLQTATIGQGVDLVFMGEGFTDKDIAEGVYKTRMMAAIEQFFSYEPYTSLRDRFNVYIVTAVSPNAEFWGNATNAINQDISKAFEYASKVPNLKQDHPMYVNVIYKSYGGQRSYCMIMEGDESYVSFVMDGEPRSTVLNHEAGGHGIGKLFDEYIELGGEGDWTNLPEEQKAGMETKWTTFGWGANVDWRSNPKEVKWAKFISDPRYADEKIGVYEGSYLYVHGAYRPTENSMMRHNNIGFNAPSREAIYKRVMRESEGDSWTYDYETFVAFDAQGHANFVDAINNNGAKLRKAPRQTEENMILTDPPVFVKGTWRDVMNKNKK